MPEAEITAGTAMAKRKQKRTVSKRRKSKVRAAPARKKTAKRAGRKGAAKKVAKRAAAKTKAKKGAAKSQAKRAVRKKAVRPPAELLEQPSEAMTEMAEERVVIDIIEEPAPGVVVVTEIETVESTKPPEDDEGSD